MMRILDTIHLVSLVILFLMVVPVVALVAALLHNERYDELSDDW